MAKKISYEEYLSSRPKQKSTTPKKISYNDYLTSKGYTTPTTTPVVPKKTSLLKQVGNVGKNIFAGAESWAGNLGSYALRGYGALTGNTKYLDLLNKGMEIGQQQIAQRTEQNTNPVLKKAAQLGTVVGQQIPTMILAAGTGGISGLGAAKVAGGLSSGVSAAGQYATEAVGKGATQGQALGIGAIKGSLEGAVDTIGVGAVLKGTNAVSKGLIKEGVKQWGINITNNAIQEAVQEPLNEIVDQSVLGKSDWKGIGKRMLNSGIDGALVATVMSAAGAGIGRASQIVEQARTGQPINTTEVQQVANEVQPEIDRLDNKITEKIVQEQPIQEPTNQIQTVLPQQESMPKQKGVTKKSNLSQSLQDTQVLNKEAKEALVNQKDLSYYESINNDKTMKQASDRLTQGGEQEALRWTTLKPEDATPLDVAEGIILMDNYQKQGQLDNMVSIAKKLTEIGTKSGQTVQMFSILQRMTPEGMVKYAQSQLTDIQNELQKTKTKDWIKKNVGDLTLTSQEVQTIIDKMKEVQNLTGREKIVKLAEIQKLITDKIPPEKGAGIKAYRRIAMLLNPKTIGRNILGNTLIAPLNMASESTVGTVVDKILSKYTKVRTTGVTDIKSYGKNFIQGASEAFDDFRQGLNTRDINADKFEIGMGKNFNNKTKFGQVMNKLDQLTGFSLDVGDRPFFKAEFMNSLNNQMKLNNVTKPTVDMLDIATKTAEQRTWQDTNAYTKTVTGLRTAMNKFNVKGVGLGDMIIPFAKTPANLTKALVDYSPAGVISAIIDTNKLKTAIANDQFTPQLQKKVVDDVSKAAAGTLLYIIGYALAKAGILSGKADEDKDVAKFQKDVMGIQPYSIKIGDKSFTYDWAQPLAAPLGIMANIQQKKKQGEDVSLIQDILTATSESGEMLYEQSFMQNLKRIFSSYDGVTQGLIETMANVPASFVPTLVKQLNDLYDPIARTTYEPDNIVKTGLQQAMAKIPGLSTKLAPATDVLGREVKKYGGDNNLLNVFLSPANVAKENVTEGTKELLKVYKATGDKTIIPRVAANKFDYKGTNYTLTSKEKSDWQKAIGDKTSKNLDLLVNSSDYKKLKDADKAKVMSSILNFSQTQQKYDYLKSKGVEYELDQSFIDAKDAIDKGLSSPKYFVFKNTINNLTSDKNSKGKTITSSASAKKALAILKMDATIKEKNMLLDLASPSEKPITVKELEVLPEDKEALITYINLTDKGEEKFKEALDKGIPVEELLQYVKGINKVEGIKKNGRTISGTKKAAAVRFVQGLALTREQKIYLLTMAGYKVR